MVVDDHNFPPSGRIDGANRVEEACDEDQQQAGCSQRGAVHTFAHLFDKRLHFSVVEYISVVVLDAAR